MSETRPLFPDGDDALQYWIVVPKLQDGRLYKNRHKRRRSQASISKTILSCRQDRCGMTNPQQLSAEIDHKFTDELVCPYCGHEQGDSWEIKDGECQCSKCDKNFIFESEEIRYFTSRQVPCLNGGPHIWKPMTYVPDYPYARRCTGCGKRDWDGKESQP